MKKDNLIFILNLLYLIPICILSCYCLYLIGYEGEFYILAFGGFTIFFVIIFNVILDKLIKQWYYNYRKRGNDHVKTVSSNTPL